MCDATAYLKRDGQEEMVMESVEILEPEDGQLRIKNVFGEEKKLKARIKGLSLVDHKIILEPL
jgi:predicted RNA-binding protein